MPASADRNLLFGILAVQLDFVSKDALIAAMNAWVLDKQKPLGKILCDQGHLSTERLQLLTALVNEHLRQHGNDPQQSLAALSSIEPTFRQQLAVLPDASIQKSIGHVGKDREPTTPVDAGATLRQSPVSAPMAGRFRILRHHKDGGLGSLFVAEDTELGRHVALKEIQQQHANETNSRHRFVLEAEITGGLEHPGIVPVYGLGSYADGRPFYAMRFIKGDNLQQAVRRFHAVSPVRFDSLESRQLLRRFVDVCNAVAYAHSRGVLHRDLKPGNIMLGKFGETLVVDWGLAKPTAVDGHAAPVSPPEAAEPPLTPRLSGDSSATVAGRALGTPAYMSPEQARGDLHLLGPATDVYSLGATLYEVLVGHSPFSGSQAEILSRVIDGAYAPPRVVNAAVPRALEAICLKAMSMQPTDRYASTQALAGDIERWLADESVTAYREPLAASARRWVRRHARVVTAAGAALLVAAVALGLLAWQRELARQAVSQEQAETVKERDAKEIARAAAVAANEQAQKRLKQVERANEILGSIFVDLDPTKAEKEGKPLQAVLGERLDRATAEIEGDAIGDSLAVARMQMTLGGSQLGLGYPDKAIRLFTRARATFATQLGPDNSETLACMNNLAQGFQAAGKLDLALPLFEETLKLQKATLGPDHLDTVCTMNNLAYGYQATGKLDLALPLFEETLKLYKAKLGPDHPYTFGSMSSVASVYQDAGKLDAALRLYEETLRLQKAKLGHDHLNTILTMNNLAVAYRAAGKLDAALLLQEEALKLYKAKLGPDHPDTFGSMNSLAVGYQTAGKLVLALPLFEETLKLRKAKLGADHPDTLVSMNNLAVGYHVAGKRNLTVPLLEDALKLRKAKLGADHPLTIQSMHNLASAYQGVGKLDAALPLYEEALKLRKAKLGADNPGTLTSMNNLAQGYQAAGKLDLALPLFEETLKVRTAKLGPGHPDTLLSMSNLASGYQDAGKLDAALPLFEEAARGMEQRKFQYQYARSILANTADCLERLKRFEPAEAWRRKWLAVVKERDGTDSPAYAAELSGLGDNLLLQHKWADAETVLRECLTIREKKQPDEWATFDTRSLLGASLLGQQKHADAEPLLLAGFAGMKQRADKIPPQGKPRLAEAAEQLVKLCEATGKPDEAEKWRKERDAAKGAAAAKP
jgi:tetratricopeptide (TPR) repeat protein